MTNDKPTVDLPPFYLEWENVDPPPGADPDSKWRRCRAGCTRCNYNTTFGSIITDMHPEIEVEERVLDILRFSATPLHCTHFTDFINEYGKQSRAHKAIVDDLKKATLEQLKLLVETREKESHDNTQRTQGRNRKQSAPSRRSGKHTQRKKAARTPSGSSVSGRNGRKATRPAEENRRVAPSKKVRNPVGKRAGKTDAGSD